MPRALKLHPNSRCDAITSLAVGVRRKGGALSLEYSAAGAIGDLRIPPVAASARADDLWRHTCFEAFVRLPDSKAYHEFNFAPTTQWAAYSFSDYRQGMHMANPIAAPRINARSAPDRFILSVLLDITALPNLRADSVWLVGLSAVIEEMNGCISYWALAHPAGKADFHHPDCFELQLPPASRV